MAETGFQGDRSNSVKIEGIESIQRALLALPGTVGRKYLGKAMKRAIAPMEAQLRANTPVGPTGNLRAAVGQKVRTYSSGTAFGIVGYKRAVSKDTADNKGYHSHFVEFGTNERRPTKAPFLSSYGIKDWRPPGWNGPWPMVARYVRGAKALHPLKRAWDATYSQCVGTLVVEMESAFEKAVEEVNREGGA